MAFFWVLFLRVLFVWVLFLRLPEEEIVFAEGSCFTNDLLPILDCKTRWSSAFYFVKRAVKLRRAINEIAKDADLRRNEIENEDWYILSEVLEFLEGFATITKYIKGSGFPILSLVVPMYNRLLMILEDFSQSRHTLIKQPLIVTAAATGLEKLSLLRQGIPYCYGGHFPGSQAKDAIFHRQRLGLWGRIPRCLSTSGRISHHKQSYASVSYIESDTICLEEL
ncbi:hypothetical protein OUZ56_010938 [Daphnia magna]|uniref:Uncharacterized protein n=1 Tax=Daphnia magna TaxID=35525 RepID=A0ABQ9YYY7_9CRUS|nr:hypothetical protein OUZ56_010938 [Daphnia magna]